MDCVFPPPLFILLLFLLAVLLVPLQFDWVWERSFEGFLYLAIDSSSLSLFDPPSCPTPTPPPFPFAVAHRSTRLASYRHRRQQSQRQRASVSVLLNWPFVSFRAFSLPLRSPLSIPQPCAPLPKQIVSLKPALVRVVDFIKKLPIRAGVYSLPLLRLPSPGPLPSWPQVSSSSITPLFHGNEKAYG